MSERLDKSHLVICVLAMIVLMAGFIIRTRFFDNPIGLFCMALWGSVAMVCFFCLGFISRAVLCDVFVIPKEKKGEKELEVAPGADIETVIAIPVEDTYVNGLNGQNGHDIHNENYSTYINTGDEEEFHETMLHDVMQHAEV